MVSSALLALPVNTDLLGIVYNLSYLSYNFFTVFWYFKEFFKALKYPSIASLDILYSKYLNAYFPQYTG